MRVGITGSTGFIGWHLRARLLLEPAIEVIPLTRDDFAEPERLAKAVASCDAVVHLAGGRFSEDDGEDYAANMALTNGILAALRHAPKPLLFASSMSMEKDTGYGRAKRDGSAKALAYGSETGIPVLSLVMPNVVGEFAQPHHHTAVATFCQDIADGKPSVVNEAGAVELIHPRDAADRIVAFLASPAAGEERLEGEQISIPALYGLLSGFAQTYRSGTFPRCESLFERRLFTMLYSYMFESLVPRPLSPRADARGTLVETVRTLSPGQSFMSTTVPGAVRGEHYHIRKTERFAVVKGEAVVRLRKLMDDRVLEYRVSGDAPCYIDMPTFYTHHIVNTGAGELVTSFWTDELYDEADPDTYPEPVNRS